MLTILLRIIFSYGLLSGFILQAAEYHKLTSWYEAKYYAKEVYKNHQKTFYCGCDYDALGVTGSCGYLAPEGRRNPNKVDFDHVVSTWEFGHERECWDKNICTTKRGQTFSGDLCCAKVDEQYLKMSADLYNIVPEIAVLKEDRGERVFGKVVGEQRLYGDCDFEVGVDKVEPAENIRGDIARIYFYMSDTYNLTIDPLNWDLFKIWDRVDPVDDWERQRAKRIEEIQHTKNKFVK